MKVYIKTTGPNMAEAIFTQITDGFDFDTYEAMIQGFSFVTARTPWQVLNELAHQRLMSEVAEITFKDLEA